MQALSCIDQCFIADHTLEHLPEPSAIGKAKVGGLDFNMQRIRRVTEALLALSWRPGGFTSSELAVQVVRCNGQPKGETRHYQATPAGLKTIAALVVLREKAIRPLLAAAQEIHPSRGSQNPTALDRHYQTVRTGMMGIFRESRSSRLMIDKEFIGFRP